MSSTIPFVHWPGNMGPMDWPGKMGGNECPGWTIRGMECPGRTEGGGKNPAGQALVIVTSVAAPNAWGKGGIETPWPCHGAPEKDPG
mmetsp:Transcript_60558/g.142642  ORF Transcript_60558/g.142642 Transcript_60558/m.142642 type:complete len:87 (-) Transcript_60558:402-662(-)